MSKKIWLPESEGLKIRPYCLTGGIHGGTEISQVTVLISSNP